MQIDWLEDHLGVLALIEVIVLVRSKEFTVTLP